MNHPCRGVFPKPTAACRDRFALTCDRLGCISCRRGRTDLHFLIEWFVCLFCMFYISKSFWECMLLAGWAMKGKVIFAGGQYKLCLMSVSIPIQSALWVTNFVSLARSRLLFALLLRLLWFWLSVSIVFQSVGRFFGVSGNDPFRLCVVLVTGICTSSSWIESGRING